jgi:hypothetical protein
MKVPSYRHLSDDTLTTVLASAVQGERRSTVVVIALLEEFDRRRLFLPAGYPSLFAYCTQQLHLGEGAAYSRIEAARAVRRFPLILKLLAQGDINLSTVGLIARHLTERNFEDLLAEVRHRSKREVEIIVARLAPRPDAVTVIRRAPAPTTPPMGPTLQSTAVVVPQPAVIPPDTARPRPVVAALAPERFKLQITMSQRTHDTLRQLQNLMRHSIPSGDAALIVERALELLLQEVLRKKCGMRKRDLPALDPEQPEIGGHERLIH